MGVRVGEWQRRQIKEYAREALAARQQVKGAERRLRELAVGNKVLEAQGKVVGIADGVCSLDKHGGPAEVSRGGGLPQGDGFEPEGAKQRRLIRGNCGLASGGVRGRGNGSISPRCGWCRHSGVRPWYEAKKARNEDDARRVVVAVMRKLAMALYHVGVKGEEFQPRRLFGRIGRRCGVQAKSRT